MMPRPLWVLFVLGTVLPAAAAPVSTSTRLAVQSPASAPPLEKLAARELAQSLGKLFGGSVPLGEGLPIRAETVLLVGSPQTNPLVRRAAGSVWPRLSHQGHALLPARLDNRRCLIVGGGSSVATLWAAYALLQRLGARTFLTGELLPSARPPWDPQALKQQFEPRIRERAWVLDASYPLGAAAWPLADQQRLLRRLARWRFNRLVVRVPTPSAFLTTAVNEAATAPLGELPPLRVDGDTPGRAPFAGAPLFINPDLAPSGKGDVSVRKAVALLRGVLTSAAGLGFQTCLRLTPFDSLVPDWSAPAVAEQAKSLIRAAVTTYPNLDELSLDMSTLPPGTPAWDVLRKVLSTPRLLRSPDGRNLHVRLTGSSITGGALPPGVALDAARPVELGTAASLLPTPGGALAAAAAGVPGFEIRGSPQEEHSLAAHLLSAAAWATPSDAPAAIIDLYGVACGEGVADRVRLGFDRAEAGFAAVGDDASFRSPSRSLVAEEWMAGPPPEHWKTAREHYTAAMDEMYRALRRAREESRPYLLYLAKRFEYALHLLNSREALRLAGAAGRAGDRRTALEQSTKATESAYSALSALGEVARDPTDRGTIALLAEVLYRPLRARLNELEAAP